MRRAFPSVLLGPILLAFAAAATGCAADPAQKMLVEGWQQLGAKQPDRALVTAQNILAEVPNSPRAAEVYYLKGRALEEKTASTPAEQRNNLTAAFDAYAEALRRNPRGPLQGRVYAGMANVAYWQDDYSTAWRHWATAYDLADDDATRAYILYRIGLCQQRLGRFDEADRTLAAVVQRFPNTDPANRARQKVGVRAFSVQVATYANPQSAENAMQALRREGFIPSRSPNARGQNVVSVTPFPSYQQAKAAKDRLAGLFPDALVIP
jgi:tetratricopeptide (TPR) repeat protein